MKKEDHVLACSIKKKKKHFSNCVKNFNKQFIKEDIEIYTKIMKKDLSHVSVPGYFVQRGSMVFERRKVEVVDFNTLEKVSLPVEKCEVVLGRVKMEEVKEFKYLGTVLC